MKLNPLSFVLSLFFVSIYGQNLFDTLNSNGFTDYASALQLNPELLQRLNGRNDITVWAPINDAFNSVQGKLRPRQNNATANALLGNSMTHEGIPPGAATAKKRQAGTPDSNFRTLRTFLEDPEFVNLGRNQPVRIVSNYAAPPPGSSLATIEIVSGSGPTVDQIAGPFKYDNGLIYGVKDFFNLPLPLMDSLLAVGLDNFRNEVIASGLEETLSETPGVTIFAPSNFTSGNFNISTHVITNGFLGFLPQLFDTADLRTDSGLPISVTLEDGIFYINGVRIIRADIIVKNGVVYEIEQPLCNGDGHYY